MACLAVSWRDRFAVLHTPSTQLLLPCNFVVVLTLLPSCQQDQIGFPEDLVFVVWLIELRINRMVLPVVQHSNASTRALRTHLANLVLADRMWRLRDAQAAAQDQQHRQSWAAGSNDATLADRQDLNSSRLKAPFIISTMCFHFVNEVQAPAVRCQAVYRQH